ncbi:MULTISPECIES: SH3 domain-containing protein [Flavobacterium]|uniref:SH3b domain-containing protein n=1 Tax=Flavobacterium hankyongi TaxID=1176532 RepID=A0ABP9A0J5_9FLAO|nr:SH3 domain-containing protein [Flavobacterium sp. N1846]
MKEKIAYFFIFLFLASCNGQNKKVNDCNSKETVIEKISEINEIKIKQKYIDSISNKTRGVSYIIDEVKKINGKEFYVVKTGVNGKSRWESFYTFYVNKKNCNDICVDNPITGEIITLVEWRSDKKIKNKKMEEKKIGFSDLFRESEIIKFTPNDLNNNNQTKEFKRKLEIFEKQNPSIEDFDIENLTILINNETFSNSEGYIDSSWLNYFIKKYKIEVFKMVDLMTLAIKQEDYNAIKVLVNNHFIVSLIEMQNVKETKDKSLKMIKLNKNNKGLDENGDPTFYESEKSKINDIEIFLKEKFFNNKIDDSDGYTNLRESKTKESKIIEKILTGEKVEVLDNTSNWLLIKTKSGKKGYINKSKLTTK